MHQFILLGRRQTTATCKHVAYLSVGWLVTGFGHVYMRRPEAKVDHNILKNLVYLANALAHYADDLKNFLSNKNSSNTLFGLLERFEKPVKECY